MDSQALVEQLMTPNPSTVSANATLRDAAFVMESSDVGAVVALNEDGTIFGILTDRDIVVRALAAGRDPQLTTVGEVCSRELLALSPDQTVTDAARIMVEHSVRRLPVLKGGIPVGIVSLGDLALARDPDSALGAISAAPANR